MRLRAFTAFNARHARSLSTVRLALDKYAAPSSDAKEPLVVLHGLYGSKQNWRSLARGMAQRLNRDILTLVSSTCACFLRLTMRS